MSAPLRLERSGPIARLIIERAAQRNAFTQEMWDGFPLLLAEAVADEAVRVLVLQSAVPGAFSAGADIVEFSAFARDERWMQRNRESIRRAQRDLTRARKPTIALIEGVCAGGGCGLALACDVRIAAPAARLGIPAAKLGLVYSLHDTKLLTDLVGPSQAKRLLFTGQLVEAAEAARIGLVDLVSPDAAAEAAALAGSISAVSPHSVTVMKTIIRRILDGQTDDDESTLREFDGAFAGADFEEGVSAFLEKRPPRFRRD